MPGRHLALEPGGPRRVRVRWAWGYRDVRVELDGREIAHVDDPDALREGRSFELVGGSQLTLRLERILLPALVIERDGRPLPGSDTDARHVARIASWVLFFIAIAAFVLGGSVWLASPDRLDESATASLTVGAVITVVFAILGVLVRRGRAWAALVAGLLEVLDAINATVGALSGDASWFGVVARVAFVVILLRAWLVMRREGEPDADAEAH